MKKDWFFVLTIILISFLSFQLGKISKISNIEPIKIERANIEEIFIPNKFIDQNIEGRMFYFEDQFSKSLDFKVVASKNSNKYHFPWCPGAKRIKEENKIYFNSEKEAISKGYTLAGNCQK